MCTTRLFSVEQSEPVDEEKLLYLYRSYYEGRIREVDFICSYTDTIYEKIKSIVFFID